MQLTIEKLIYGGDGLARLHSDQPGGEVDSRGKTVFLPFVLAGERVEASLISEKPGFARAELQRIIDPSPHRVQPACPYFAACGGCNYQQASYEHQLEIKEKILRETLRRTAKIELDGEIQIHPSPPWNYRNRSRLQVHAGPPFAVGYHKTGSHELQSVEECPISSPLINRAIASLWRKGRSGAMPNGVSEIEFFANADDIQLLVELSCEEDARRKDVRALAESLISEMPEIVGVVAFRNADRGMQSAERFLSVGCDHLIYQTKAGSFRVTAGSFFQTNRFLIDRLVEIVTSEQSGELALDLYAGVGLFSTGLSDMRHIVSVESSQTSSTDLSYNLASKGEAIQASTEQYLARTLNSGRVGTGAVLPHISYMPDLAVVDPPRSGLGERVVRLLAKLGAPRVTYVSCDPATMARDLVPLLASGYHIEETHLVDLFPQTYHLETVIKLLR
ncbi:MAG TPA: 23S rRNA (uracil(1939)-C(5))-methyltransferase RlmD [Verrucomicrobiae bacterium]|nr:23S rRNA (uracil(1939)-C(5))-methyltransferase RlmD [Verrucomicrobiae bacterium]